MTRTLNLAPPLVDAGKFSELINAGQTLSSSLSPLDNSAAIFIKNLDPSQGGKARNAADQDQPIYFARYDEVPLSERRLFITDTLIIFAAFQNLMKAAQTQHPEWIQSDQTITMIRKLAIDYVNFIKECWVHASQDIPRPDGPLQFSSDHYRSLYTSFSLFVVLFIAEPGYEQAPVGDDLMEWLNIHFIEPSTEEGDHLSALDCPWEDETFWPYLTRTVLRGLSKASLFFFGVLAQHPSKDLQRVTKMIMPLIDAQPRLQNFTAERDFAHASRRWKDKVKALRVEMDRIPESSRQDDFDNWWDRLSDVVGILEGRAEVLTRVCDELGADWKEVCIAWSIFVDPRTRRQDLPDIVAHILDDMPPDPTSSEDMIHAALFSGQSTEVLEHAAKLDRWLSAHLADVMQPLSLIPTEIDDDSGLSLRDQYILSYADYLHSDPALWRITVDYMYSCGDIGTEQADEILLRVPLRLRHKSVDPELADRIRAGDIVGVLKDVNETCHQHRREAVRRTVCRVAAQTLVEDKHYGLAVSYCTSAEDWTGLGRVIDRLLDEYVTSGPESFVKYASSVAPSIPELRNEAITQGVFIHRLVFAVRYAHFHELLRSQQYQDAASDLVTIFQEDVAPKSWWAVMLIDAIPLLQFEPLLLFSSTSASLLLQRVEEIFIRSSQGSGDDYLNVIQRTIPVKGHKVALERLKTVRLALARYLARCTILSAESQPAN